MEIYIDAFFKQVVLLSVRHLPKKVNPNMILDIELKWIYRVFIKYCVFPCSAGV